MSLNSELRNAVFGFSEMTTSVVAVITDVVRTGSPVTGFAFNSTGRDARGALAASLLAFLLFLLPLLLLVFLLACVGVLVGLLLRLLHL